MAQFPTGSYGVKLGNKAVEIRRNLRLIHQFAHCSVSEFINTQIFISNYCINSCKSLPSAPHFPLPYTFSLTTGGFICVDAFAQAQTREEYLAYLADEADRNIAYDPQPIGRYNVAPGTKVLLLSERDEQLHLDPVIWGYAPGWWDKAPLINARVATAASSRMFKPLWQHGRAICFADRWFEWKKEGDKNSRISFTERTGSRYSWLPLAVRRLSAVMKQRDF